MRVHKCNSISIFDCSAPPYVWNCPPLSWIIDSTIDPLEVTFSLQKRGVFSHILGFLQRLDCAASKPQKCWPGDL